MTIRTIIGTPALSPDPLGIVVSGNSVTDSQADGFRPSRCDCYGPCRCLVKDKLMPVAQVSCNMALGEDEILDLVDIAEHAYQRYLTCGKPNRSAEREELQYAKQQLREAVLTLRQQLAEAKAETALAEDVIRTWRETADTMQVRAEKAEAELAVRHEEYRVATDEEFTRCRKLLRIWCAQDVPYADHSDLPHDHISPTAPWLGTVTCQAKVLFPDIQPSNPVNAKRLAGGA